MAKFCTECGAELRDPTSKFCRECGAQIQTQPPPATEEQSAVPPLQARQPEISPDQPQTEEITYVHKSPAIATLLSFFVPGLGQLYNGQMGKGIGMIILAAILILVVPMIFYGMGTFGLVLYIFLWLFGMYDAYKIAKSINARKIVVHKETEEEKQKKQKDQFDRFMKDSNKQNREFAQKQQDDAHKRSVEMSKKSLDDFNKRSQDFAKKSFDDFNKRNREF